MSGFKENYELQLKVSILFAFIIGTVLMIVTVTSLDYDTIAWMSLLFGYVGLLYFVGMRVTEPREKQMSPLLRIGLPFLLFLIIFVPLPNPLNIRDRSLAYLLVNTTPLAILFLILNHRKMRELEEPDLHTIPRSLD